MSAKQLMLPANRVFNSDGAPEAGAMAFLYQSGTSTPALFYEDIGLTVSLGSHITANSAGRFTPMPYQEATTAFRLVIEDAAGAVLDDIDPFYFGQNIYNVSGSVTAATRTLLAAMAGPVGSAVTLTESGREGTFYWTSANMATAVTADPAQGVVVPPATDTTGASGAWVRRPVGMTLTPTMFGGVKYNVSSPVDASVALNAFFVHAQNTDNARNYVYDFSGEWYITNPIYALYTSSNPDAVRQFVCGTLRVAPKASLPGGTFMFAAMTIADYYANWKGRLSVQEAGTVPYNNTTYYTRRYRHGVRLTQMGMSVFENPIVVDGAIREGVLFEGREAGITINGTALGGQNSIGARLGGVVARYCGTCQHFDTAQGPTALTKSSITQGYASGSLWTNTEVFNAGSAGHENFDDQRTKITVGGGTTTADLEINDMIWGRLELTPAIYGTIQATADADPTTGTFVWSAGNPTNIDGAGNGLKIGDLYPVFQAGPNVGKEFIITGFSGGSSRTVAVARRDIYNTTIVVTAHAATADPTYKQYGPKSWHWVSRIVDSTNFHVTPWYPPQLNSTISIVNGAALHTDGEDLANVAIGTVVGNICGMAYYHRGNFAPTIETVLGQVCGTTLRIGDQSYGGGIGTCIKHGHSEGSLMDLITAGGVSGVIDMLSFFDINKTLAYTPRNAVNDMTGTQLRTLGPVRITDSAGVQHVPQSGGVQEGASGQSFISNGAYYRYLHTDGSFPTIEVRYDAEEADRFSKHHWAEVVVMANTGAPVGGSIAFTLSKKLQALGWTFSAHAGGGVTHTAVVANQPYKLRLFYLANQKKIGVERSQYMLDVSGDLRAPNNLYVGEYSSGAGYTDGKEFVLRNSSGYGFKAFMNGATSALYTDNFKPGFGFSEWNIRGLPIVLWGDGASITATVNVTGINLATGKHLQVNGTTIIDGSTNRLTATGMPALTGDITTAGAALATTIANNAVTYAKFQQVAASSLVGNATGSLANATGITLAGGLAFAGSTLTAAGALTPTSVASTGTMTSSSATAGIGYAAGSRGTQTQATSKATGVTSNTVVTDITLNAAALAADTTVSFVFTNSAIGANDTLILNHATTGTFGSYLLNAHGFASGSCTIDVRNITPGSLSEAIVIRAVLVKGG